MQIPLFPTPSTVAIIGAGPAGLMAAEVIASAGHAVAIYDAMPSVGRKFLLAGVGGMNITHAEALDLFLSRYASNEDLQPLLAIVRQFDANAVRAWVQALGIDTFVGSSGRVFPQGMKAAPLLRAWLHRLRGLGVKIHPRHRWQGWSPELGCVFTAREKGQELSKIVSADACVFALGGASWSRLGSDGAWVPLFRQRDIRVEDLSPSNCGFEVPWSSVLREQFAGAPLHGVGLSCVDLGGQRHSLRSELVISAYGLEGNGIYALSKYLREQIQHRGSACLTLDLLPDMSAEHLAERLAKPRGKNSLSNFLRKQTHLPPEKLALLREFTDKAVFQNPVLLAQALKNLPVSLLATRPIDEAISSAGGIAWSELSEDLMLRKIPGVFCAGEMLNWEAPTGGYLLNGCFATGRAAGMGVVKYLREL